MRTLTCTLSFENGSKLVAKATAKGAEDTVRIDYSGDTSRLKPFAEKGTLGFIEWYLRGCAANAGAAIQVNHEGEFD